MKWINNWTKNKTFWFSFSFLILPNREALRNSLNFLEFGFHVCKIRIKTTLATSLRLWEDQAGITSMKQLYEIYSSL